MTRGGLMGTPCECEQAKCHGPNGCSGAATQRVLTDYGIFFMCIHCANRLPDKYHMYECECETCNIRRRGSWQ